MTRKRRRLTLLLLCALGLGTAAGLSLFAFQDNLLYFYTPSELAQKPPGPDQRFRLGGLVEDGSLVREADGMTVAFTVTDTKTELRVRYTGALPDLFGEGQGVVAHGRLQPDGTFLADELLAKHDETYMPPEVAAGIAAAGHPTEAETAE
jgi:cytochrome c-type biogenesis protein CcmE